MSLFCGSCAIESVIQGFDRIICNDKHEYIIEMFRAAQNGRIFPSDITKEEYQYIRQHRDEDKALSGFVGHGCSFGGKWFGGYASDNKGRNYCREAKETLERDMKGLMNAEFICMDYRDVPLPDGCVVLCDPPYAGTTQYGEKFDTEKFWEYIRQISKDHMVFVCEENAPDDFVSIWQRPLKRTLDINKKNQPSRIEKLFVHESQLGRN